MTFLQMKSAFRLGLAAWAAFAIATCLGIDHAYWASMPVWVVSQPWRGVTLERAIWRLTGTIIGGALGLALLALSPAPWLTAIVLALLVALGAAMIHLWHGVRTYVPLMSAITLGVVVIPVLLNPTDDFSLALDRLACTFIGGLCVALIVSPFTPHADVQGFRAAGISLANRFIETARKLLQDDVPATELDDEFSQTIRTGANLEARARLVSAASRDGRHRMAALDAILAAGLSLLEAATVASKQTASRSRALDYLQEGPVAVPNTASPDLEQLVKSRHQLALATTELQAVAPSGRDLTTLAPPRNPALAWRRAILALVASLCGSALMFLTGSAATEPAAFSMTIFALVLGSVAVPHSMAPKLGTGVVLGVVAAMIYRLGVQPHVTGWTSLVLSILPFVAVGAIARVKPATAAYALDANMCFMLASQAGASPAPAPEVLYSGLAMAAGTLVVVALVMVLPRPGDHLVVRAEARLRRDIKLLSERPVPLEPSSWTAIWSRRLLTLARSLEGTQTGLPRRLLDLVIEGQQVNEQRWSKQERQKRYGTND